MPLHSRGGIATASATSRAGENAGAFPCAAATDDFIVFGEVAPAVWKGVEFTGQALMIPRVAVEPGERRCSHNRCIREVVPEDDGKAARDVAVEFATGFIQRAVIGMACR